jgi:hypothetical protein
MQRVQATAIWVAAFLAAAAPRALAADSATLRAAEAGLAPEFCPTLQAIVAAAPDGFTSLRGKSRERGEHIWDGTKRLPGSTDCTVYGGTPPAYACTLYAGDVEENADATYESAAAGLKDCLPASWKRTEKADGTHARTTSAGDPAGPRVRVVERDASADAYLVELWVDGKTP